MDDKKKMNTKRSTNFHYEEEQLLIGLIDKYKNIIECKKSGCVMWKQKEATWHKIQEEFNSKSKSNSFRTIKTLKEKYINMKKNAKKKFSSNKENMSGTGGGPAKIVTISDVDEAIKNIIGIQIEGLHNGYDDDTAHGSAKIDAANLQQDIENITLQFDQNDKIATEVEEPENVIEETRSDLLINKQNVNAVESHNWSSYSTSDLKKPVSSKLQTKKVSNKSQNTLLGGKKYTNIQHQLMVEKLDFVRLQREKFLEEHELKMILLKKKIEAIDSHNRDNQKDEASLL